MGCFLYYLSICIYIVQALMAIKSLLTDPLLVLQSWDTNSEDPCTWKGITCSDDAHTVTRL